MCTFELRESDQPGLIPQHVLFMAKKILRMGIRGSIYIIFRCVLTSENITRRIIEHRDYVVRLVDKKFVFLKINPNSVQLWVDRKNDPSSAFNSG